MKKVTVKVEKANFNVILSDAALEMINAAGGGGGGGGSSGFFNKAARGGGSSGGGGSRGFFNKTARGGFRG